MAINFQTNDIQLDDLGANQNPAFGIGGYESFDGLRFLIVQPGDLKDLLDNSKVYDALYKKLKESGVEVEEFTYLENGGDYDYQIGPFRNLKPLSDYASDNSYRVDYANVEQPYDVILETIRELSNDMNIPYDQLFRKLSKYIAYEPEFDKYYFLQIPEA